MCVAKINADRRTTMYALCCFVYHQVCVASVLPLCHRDNMVKQSVVMPTREIVSASVLPCGNVWFKIGAACQSSLLFTSLQTSVCV